MTFVWKLGWKYVEIRKSWRPSPLKVFNINVQDRRPCCQNQTLDLTRRQLDIRCARFQTGEKIVLLSPSLEAPMVSSRRLAHMATSDEASSQSISNPRDQPLPLPTGSQSLELGDLG